LVLADPSWKHPDYPYGLALFDPEYNCAAILGMRYFGEFKKGTLTLAWTIAGRKGYIPCHGGVKRYNFEDKDSVVVGVFGLSGSGKSTLVHAKHDHKYDISVLHDDAFIVSTETGHSIALEPSYFDKTADYPLESEDNKYLLSVQNCGVTLNENGKKVIVCEDIRNSNGRAIKSKLWSPNRVDKMNDELVIEPYANPFRIYPLKEDYNKFKKYLQEHDARCYILNTGDFMGSKVTKEMTLSILEKIVKNDLDTKEWEGVPGMRIPFIEGFTPDMSDLGYCNELYEVMLQRRNFIKEGQKETSGINGLPDQAFNVMESISQSLESIII